MTEQPAYPIASVDHALTLARLLSRGEPLRVTDAAAHLGVAPSTAHRLMAMLVYHDFAEQGPDRRYHPGSILQRTLHSSAAVALLRHVARPHMEMLVRASAETVNLTILSGTAVHFIATVEGSQALRVGDRTGASLPAQRSSGGKAMLARLPRDEVCALYAAIEGVNLTAVLDELEEVRDRNFAINDEQTEKGLSAVGVAIRLPEGMQPGAVSLAMPSVRFDEKNALEWAKVLSTASERITVDMAAAQAGQRHPPAEWDTPLRSSDLAPCR